MSTESLFAAHDELRQATAECDQLSALSRLNGQQRNRFDYLLSKISATKAIIAAEEERTNRVAGDRQREVRKQQDEIREFLISGKGEQRGMTEGSDSAGGFLIAPDYSFAQEVAQGLKTYDAIFDLADVETGDNLRPKTYPVADFTLYSDSAIAEDGQFPTLSGGVPTVSQIPLLSSTVLGKPSAFYRSNACPVSLELASDAYESVEVLLKQIFTLSTARGVGHDLIAGSSTAPSAMPGLLTQAPVKVTAASATLIAAADLEALYFSVDRVYRVQPGAAWLMNDATYLAVRKLTDTTNGRPLINIVDDRELLLGHPIGISPSMPGLVAGNKAIAFGWMKALKVRRTPSVIKRKTQVTGYIERGQILVTMHSRWASSILQPVTANPIALLQMAAS